MKHWISHSRKAAGMICGFILCGMALNGIPACAVGASKPETTVPVLNGESYTSSTPASSEYPDTGGTELCDGVFGTDNFKDAAWQGRQWAETYTQTVDLGTDCCITGASARFLQASGCAIEYPSEVRFSVSSDGTTFAPLGAAYKTETEKNIAIYTRTLSNALRARYIRIDVTAAGEWTFCDEVWANGIRDDARNVAATKRYVVSENADENYPDPNGKELCDGIYANDNFHDEAWQGRLGDYSVTVDLGTVVQTTGCCINFLEYPGGGIYFPRTVTCSTSVDNVTFSPVGQASAQTSGTATQKYALTFEQPVCTRYVRFDIAASEPSAWVFMDEAEVLGYPIVSGSFIQLSYGDIWTAEDWDRELKSMKDLGMDHIILQWIVDRSPSEPAVYYDSDIYNEASGYPCRNGDDTLMNVLTAAENNGMDVWVGLAANEEWWDKANDPEWLAAEAAENMRIIQEIWDSPRGYRNKASFKGWYNVWEIENYRFRYKPEQEKLRSALKTIVDYAHSYTGKPIMTSPYIGRYSEGLKPDGWQDMWTYLLDPSNGACFDVVAPQDNFGNITETYIAAMKQAVDTNPNCELWSNIETYQNPAVNAGPTITLIKQINEENRYVRKMTSFSYLHYHSPSVVGPCESEDWKRVIYPRIGKNYSGPEAGYEDKAAGKPYTASVAAGVVSPDSEGTELTDRKYAGAVIYTQSPYQARENVPSYEFTIDLQQDTEFSTVLLNFIKQGEAGVDFPEKVSYYASSDDVNFTLLGEVQAPGTNRTAYADHYTLELAEPFTARYVKAVVTTGTDRITACDEFEVIGLA